MHPVTVLRCKHSLVDAFADGVIIAQMGEGVAHGSCFRGISGKVRGSCPGLRVSATCTQRTPIFK
jgi:hypothetical protein